MMVCISACLIGRGFSLWLSTTMVVVLWFSLASILAQWIAIVVELWSGGWARPFPAHFDDCASPAEPKIMSRLCGELYCVSIVGHVRGEE